MNQAKICHVLLIEDDEIDRLLVRTLVNAHAPGRFRLVETGDLGRGLELLRERSFDLVLLDHTIPQLTSVQELRLVLAQQASGAVIMHTGYIAADTESEALAMGVRQVVEKGELDPLWNAIERALDHEGENVTGHPPEAVEGKTVLVVEDEPAVRRVMRIALELAGCTVQEASNGEEALEQMHRIGREVDLVIADLLMPRTSGTTLASALQRVRPELPVLFVSGASDTDLQRILGRTPEDDEVLWKPFTPEQLVDAAERLLPKS
jgi:DNA-binding NtrC family response regulator